MPKAGGLGGPGVAKPAARSVPVIPAQMPGNSFNLDVIKAVFRIARSSSDASSFSTTSSPILSWITIHIYHFFDLTLFCKSYA
jgi:hypothetical protein